MKILGLIPARGGSKRIPQKNIKLLGDDPLIVWSIKAAQKSHICEDIMVSTDDPRIAEISRHYGAYVPSLRPIELASDWASSVDVAIHALDEYQSTKGPVDGLLLLQPTSPFRTPETIRRATLLFEQNHGQYPVVGVSPASYHPAWCLRIDQRGMEPFLGWENIGKRSQDLESAYIINGAIYIISPRQLKEQHAFIIAKSKAIVMKDPVESIDIDSPFDWVVANSVLSQLGKS